MNMLSVSEEKKRGPALSFNIRRSEEVCQLCDQTSHTAIDCPWMYSKCLFPKCLRLRMLLTCDSNISKGKKYLKCHMPDCEGFQWLDDAMKGKTSSVKCYLCGEDDNVGKDCPREDYPCKLPGCSGWRHISTSHTQENPGKKFLSCDKYRSFEWLCDAIAKHEGTTKQEALLSKSSCSSRMKDKTTSYDVPDDFCEEFNLKASFNCNASDHMANECPWRSM